MSAQQPLSVVLGAGLMGRLLAHTLARLGHRVEIHEAQGPDAQGAAARVAAAMLATPHGTGVIPAARSWHLQAMCVTQ